MGSAGNRRKAVGPVGNRCVDHQVSGRDTDDRSRHTGGDAVAHEGLHEAADLLDDATIDRHRAIVSLIEEFEAIDWYDQRVTATRDPDLASILAHNRDDEKEHAAMTLEWIRRHDPALDEQLRRYLFTSGPITSVEDSPAATNAGTLNIKSLRDES
jgi:ferritin-like protein